MPRPSFFRLNKHYREVLEKLATEVFLSKDYHALKVKDFYEGMDLPAGTFYEYFENKEDLCVYLASLSFKEKFDAHGTDNVILFTHEEDDFSIFTDEDQEAGRITYEKILNCGVGFFAKLFDDYLLDMMMPIYQEGIQERIDEGIYKEDIAKQLSSYVLSLLSTFILHYFDRFEISEKEEQEYVIMMMITMVDQMLKK